MGQSLKVLVVANKTWECEPLVNVLTSSSARQPFVAGLLRGYDPAEAPIKPAPQPPPEADGLPVKGSLPIRPRLSFNVSDNLQVEVWCIEDWMRSQRHKKVGDQTQTVPASSSSSYEKFTFALPQIRKNAFGGQAPDVVIAFGTAGIPADENFCGCVSIGTRIYLHDPWADALYDDKAEQIDRFGPLLHDELGDNLDKRIDCKKWNPTVFLSMSNDARHAAEARFLKPPIDAPETLRIFAAASYASLGTLNICDYDDYIWADDETLGLFNRQIKQREIGSSETTHGLVRLTFPDAAFLFVSGLTDRIPLFNMQVVPRTYAQNFAAAHNAGVTMSYLLGDLSRIHAAGNLLA